MSFVDQRGLLAHGQLLCSLSHMHRHVVFGFAVVMPLLRLRLLPPFGHAELVVGLLRYHMCVLQLANVLDCWGLGECARRMHSIDTFMVSAWLQFCAARWLCQGIGCVHTWLSRQCCSRPGGCTHLSRSMGRAR